MKILGYKGKGLISRLIQFQTRSPYSHVAIELDDGSVVEAWHRGGVAHSENWMTLHKPGTEVDVFDLNYGGLCNFNKEAAAEWALKQVGKAYDFVSVMRFLSRRTAPANDKFFCSELVESAIRAGGGKLLNGNPSEHSPRDTLMSPCLSFIKTRKGNV